MYCLLIRVFINQFYFVFYGLFVFVIIIIIIIITIINIINIIIKTFAWIIISNIIIYLYLFVY